METGAFSRREIVRRRDAGFIGSALAKGVGNLESRTAVETGKLYVVMTPGHLLAKSLDLLPHQKLCCGPCGPTKVPLEIHTSDLLAAETGNTYCDFLSR